MNPYLIAGGAGLAFLYFNKKPGPGEPGYVPSANDAAALGVPPGQSNGRGSNLTAAIGGAVGAGACIGVASYFGATSVGLAAAPVCAKGGAAAAPFVKKGAVFLAQETAKGAVFVAKSTASGAKFVGRTVENEVVKTIQNPLTDPINKSIQLTNLTQGGLHVVDRGVTALAGKLPAPIKIAFTPIVVATKLGTKLGDAGASVAKSTVGGVKKVAGGAEKVASKIGGAIASLF
jgi:hypothetical protein